MGAGDETQPERGPNLVELIVTGCLEKLAAKSPGAAHARLRDEALACQSEVDRWRVKRPSDDERSAMRTRLLSLHERIDKL